MTIENSAMPFPCIDGLSCCALASKQALKACFYPTEVFSVILPVLLFCSRRQVFAVVTEIPVFCREIRKILDFSRLFFVFSRKMVYGQNPIVILQKPLQFGTIIKTTWKRKVKKKSKIVNCSMCGQPCEEKHAALGIIGLLFGFSMHWGSFCCEECKRQWNGGGRIWFGKKWKQQFIIALIIAVVIVVLVLALW